MRWLRAAARRDPAARELAVLTIVLSLACLLLGLPLGNQSKLFNLLFALLAAPAALGYAALAARGPRIRLALAALLAVALIPTAALFTWGFATERGQLHFTWDTPASEDERVAWSWVRAHTSPDAILVDADARLDMTVLAARSALWGGDGWAKNWGYDPRALAARRAAAATIGTGLGPTPEARRMLGDLGREVIVVARRGETRPAGGAWARLVTGEPGVPPGDLRRFTPLYRNDTVALFRWTGSR
jgi:hypothetical protein